MKKILWWTAAALGVLAVVLYFRYWKPALADRKRSYLFTELKTGNIESTISSTGTLEAINTIQVGTQISGTVHKIYVDYNDQVKAGQLLAEIDTKLLTAALGNATANAEVVKARMEQAEDEFKRNKSLYEKNVITEKEFKDSQYAFLQAASNLKAAQASMKSAAVNLSYARITSPIAGTITERAVEEGQTVAASFATPTLFIIAENLSNMQIVADVDEGDIGYIILGMKVRFSVQTYPDKKFYGQVSQIRLQPSHINNVVNYKVIVSVSNQQGLLLPGMTANLDFIAASKHNTLMVNNSAFRFHPDAGMFRKVHQKIRDKAKFLPDSVRPSFLASLDDEDTFISGEFRKRLPTGINTVFYQTGDQLNVEFVQLGITTGQESAIDKFLTGQSMPGGSRIINGIKTSEK